MLEMSRIVCDVNWAKKGEVTWNETIKKILEQASVEVTHKEKKVIVVLTYLLPDVRSKPDSDKIVYFTNVSYTSHLVSSCSVSIM